MIIVKTILANMKQFLSYLNTFFWIKIISIYDELLSDKYFCYC